MTLSLAAVFIPVLFLGGIIGRLLHEFSVVIMVAILFPVCFSDAHSDALQPVPAQPHEQKHGTACLCRWSDFSTAC